MDHTVLPATRHKRTHPALTPASEGLYSIYLTRRDGRLSRPRCVHDITQLWGMCIIGKEEEEGGWLHTKIDYPPTDGHPSKY